MSRYAGLRAVVTGGAGGIGRALCEALAARGAAVAVADVDGDAAARIAAAIGGGATSHRCDVTDREALPRLAGDCGAVDLVFANAGVYAPGRLSDNGADEIDWLFDVNVRGVIATAQAFLPALVAQAALGRPARLILTGSENSLGLPRLGLNTIYTATKHAVLGLADGLRRDLEGTGVGVSILCPGAVDTAIWNAGRARPDRYGGASIPEPGFAARARATFTRIGQNPAETAARCLAGIDRGDFLIVTHPEIRDFVTARHREVEAAIDRAARPIEENFA